jgi:hypothetical protein
MRPPPPPRAGGGGGGGPAGPAGPGPAGTRAWVGAGARATSLVLSVRKEARPGRKGSSSRLLGEVARGNGKTLVPSPPPLTRSLLVEI